MRGGASAEEEEDVRAVLCDGVLFCDVLTTAVVDRIGLRDREMLCCALTVVILRVNRVLVSAPRHLRPYK